MELLRTSEAAEKLTVARTTLLRLIRAGHLPAVRPSPRTLRIAAEDLERYLRARSTSASVRPSADGVEGVNTL